MSTFSGLQSLLHKVEVTTMANSACGGPSTAYTQAQITDNMICASDPGKDACRGDGGGKLR